MLGPKENNTIHFDVVDESDISNKNPFIVSDNNTTEAQNHTKTQNTLRKRPVVPNHFPENQTVFSKKRTVPGESSYSETVKSKMNSQSIKTFSDSIAKTLLINPLKQDMQEFRVFQGLLLNSLYIILT